MQTQAFPLETRLVKAVLLYFFVGVSVAAAVQFASSDIVAAFVSQNTMPRHARDLMLLSMAGGGGFAVLVPLLYVIWRRSGRAVDQTLRVARVLAPLLLAFMVPLLFDWHVFAGNEWACVLSALLFGLGLERSLRVSLSAVNWEPAQRWGESLALRLPRLSRRFPFLVVCTMSAFLAAYFAYLTILQHYRLRTYSWDLAIFDNMMWNLIRGKWFKASPDLGRVGSHIQYHATFIAYFFAPFYALWQRPETLLLLQAIFTSAAAIPLYLLGQLRTGSRWIGVALAYAYLIHAPMHSPVFYDFHFITTAPFWIGWVVYFFETDRRKLLVLSWVLAVLVREEMSAGLSMAALFYLLSGKRTRWALVGGIASAAYFVTVKFYIMPLHRTMSGSQSFSWMFQGLMPKGEDGFGGVLRTVISNPVYTFNSLLEQDKLTYVIKTLGPVLLLPLRHPTAWIMFIPSFIFTLLSTGYKPLYQTYFQYTSTYTSYLFFTSAVTLSWWRDRDRTVGELARCRVPAAALAMVVTATAYSYNFGAIFQHHSFHAGFQDVGFTRTPEEKKRYDELQELIRLIPKNASVAATEVEAPHVSNREDCFTLRFFYEDADYLLINLDEARSSPTKDIVTSALETGKYGFVTSRGRVALWKRGGEQTENERGLRELGIHSLKATHSHGSR
jgi:uncharacterized membrane protein